MIRRDPGWVAPCYQVIDGDNLDGSVAQVVLAHQHVSPPLCSSSSRRMYLLPSILPTDL